MNMGEITYPAVQVFLHHHPFCYARTLTLSSHLPAPFLLSMHSHPSILCLLFSFAGTGRHVPASFTHMQDLCPHPHTHSSQCIHTRPCTCTGHHLEFYPGDRTRSGGCLLSWHSRCLSPFQGNFSKIPFAYCWSLGATSEVSVGLNCSFPN